MSLYPRKQTSPGAARMSAKAKSGLMHRSNDFHSITSLARALTLRHRSKAVGRPSLTPSLPADH